MNHKSHFQTAHWNFLQLPLNVSITAKYLPQHPINKLNYCGYNLYSVDCGRNIRYSFGPLTVFMLRTALFKTGTYYQPIVIFELVVSRVMPSLTSWPPAILFKALVPYLVRHKILNWTHGKLQQFFFLGGGFTVVFLISYVLYHAFWAHTVHTANQKHDADKGITTIQENKHLQ